MSIEAMSWALDVTECAGTDKLVLIGIANHADRFGHNAFPSVDTLARYANVGRRAAQAAIAKLAALGLVVVTLNAGGYPGTPQDRRPNLYVLPHVPGHHGVHDTTPRRGARGVAGRADGVSAGAQRGAPDDALTVIEPSIEPSLFARVDEFDEFWTSYPRKVGRPQARTAWNRAIRDRHATSAAILAGLAPWVRYWSTRLVQFIPHAATWLNRDGWNDTPPPLEQPRRPGMAVDAGDDVAPGAYDVSETW